MDYLDYLNCYKTHHDKFYKEMYNSFEIHNSTNLIKNNEQHLIDDETLLFQTPFEHPFLLPS